MSAQLPGAKGDSGVSEIQKIFADMSYGPAPESDDIAKKWLAAHDKNFGHFIDGKWYHPEGERKHYSAFVKLKLRF